MSSARQMYRQRNVKKQMDVLSRGLTISPAEKGK